MRLRIAVVWPLLSVVAVVVVAAVVVSVALPERLPLSGRLAMYALVAAAVLIAYRLTRRGFWLGTEGAYRLVFENAAAGIAITTPSLKFLQANSKACETLGYPREELLEMNLGDLLSSEDSFFRPSGFEDVLVTRETIVQEHLVRRKDGAQITLEISVWPLRGRRLVVMFHDVTARREAEDALSEREALARSVVYTAVDGIITADENGVIQSFNPAAERMFGYSADQAIGSNLSILMPSPRREQHDQYIRDYLVGGIGKVIGIGREVMALRNDGTTFPVELSLSEMRLPGRRMFTGILHDSTQRNQAEAALRETNAKLEAVIHTSPLAITSVDAEGKVLGWNAAAERIFGWKAEEVLGQPIPTVPPDQRAELLESLARVAQGQTESGVARRRLRKDGSLVDLNIWTSPVRNRNGEVDAFLVILADVTQRNLLEEQFRRAQKMEAIGRLAGGVAHDFNNILTVITGYGQMALEQVTNDPGLQSSLQEILKASDHASALTGQLLVFSRHSVVNRVVVDLNEVVARLEKMLRRIIGEDVELVTAPQAGLGKVLADAAQMEQVIMNLAVNARDAMPGGGRLTIETLNVELDSWYAETHVGVQEGEYVMLAVSDTGKGVPPEARVRLFEPFFTTKERGKGTGLGLSTVYGIVKQSGGHIWVYSEAGHGATFKVYLPRVTEEQPVQEPVRETAALERGAETILLVEDEIGVRALVREVLRQTGYTVLEATDVDDALRICREYAGHIHLLLTDVVMPIMSGRELAERAASIRPELKVLYMSGYTDSVVLHHGVTSRDTQFLQKPFTPKTLASKVRAAIDATE
jgi:two-component system, cell cycle sensor histidine kinase and response regulator CckA